MPNNEGRKAEAGRKARKARKEGQIKDQMLKRAGRMAKVGSKEDRKK